MQLEVKTIRPTWSHFRVIHSRFPPVNIFDSVDAADQLLLAELEGATNDRLVNWQEWLPASEFRSGPGWGAVMASFCHYSEGRFNNADYGVYYCSDSIHTAIAEWTYHAGCFWRDHGFTDVADATVRVYKGEFELEIADVRDNSDCHQQMYHASQLLSYELKQAGFNGVLYRSVRLDQGLCAGLFAPRATTAVRQAGHYTLSWDGQRFIQFAELGEYHDI